MANHASAEKRNRQRIKRTARNRAAKSELRTALKKARSSVKDSVAEASTAVITAQSDLDRAAAKGIIPKERASRLKARLAASLHKASKSATAG
ncbi:30S ribosomal protein S20 [Chondromyces apiculatus]|uniref:Small ribosomal subunit protein bS20 n=1 Tax=Chondromyces apiculatus DSM 436 TaxID=1192034 RepID=A0A017T454_9BACT|nr:30S ribosomal protein S20 [Chondromyces apiculatus]EYF04023.1 30S ribosomal protein S20 [Chondromyces apiculatus DSM 436]